MDFTRAVAECSGRHACPDPPRCPFPTRPTCVSVAVWQRRLRNQRHLLALLHQLVPNKCVHLQPSKREGLVHRSNETWEGSVVPVIQLPALLCFLLSSLNSNSLRKESMILLFSILNPAVLCLEEVMRRSTCSKLEFLTFYFEFEVRMGPLQFSYRYFWAVYIL